MTPPTDPRRGWLPWLVGAFAAWQLVFVPLANLFEFVPHRPPEDDTVPHPAVPQRWGRVSANDGVQSAIETAGHVFGAWAELTGQEQGWATFTPGFPPQTVVPCADLILADGSTHRVLSRFEPGRGARWPLPSVREFNYEANLVMLSWWLTPQSFAENPEAWRHLPETVRQHESLLTVWLRWRAREHERSAPQKVRVAVLVLRCFPTPDGAMYERPFARLVFDRPPTPGEMPLEAFDVASGEWVRLKVWGTP